MRLIDYKFSSIAHKQALKSEMNRKLGSLVVSGKSILSFGFNRFTGMPNGPNKWSIHAEIDALSRVFNNLDERGLTLYIIRKGYLLSKPCSRCMSQLNKSGISRIVYSDGGEIKEMRI